MGQKEVAFEAAQSGLVERLDELLSAEPSLAAARNETGVSILMQSLYYRQEASVERLLAEGPELDLFEASALGKVERLEELLREAPDDLGDLSTDGFTALHFACFFARPEAVEVLLRHRPPLEQVARNPTAVAPLNSAVAGGSLRAAELLLEAGANVDVRQAEGFTPLMGAAFAGNTVMLELLLRHGADRDLTNDAGKSAADLAEERGHSEIAESLRREPGEAKPRLLFLCTGNACRSQMAEGWARHLRGDVLEVRSAGTKPAGLDARATAVMAEVGVDLSGHTSKTVTDALEEGDFDYVVTVCDHAAESCPVFPGQAKILHRGFKDPAHAEGSEEEVLAIFRRVRDEIRSYVETLPTGLE